MLKTKCEFRKRCKSSETLPSLRVSKKDFSGVCFNQGYENFITKYDVTSQLSIRRNDVFDEQLEKLDDDLKEQAAKKVYLEYSIKWWTNIVLWVKGVFDRRKVVTDAIFLIKKGDSVAESVWSVCDCLFQKYHLTAVKVNDVNDLLWQIKKSRPVLVHCASILKSNPIAEPCVKLVAFDFAESSALLSDASSIALGAYGYDSVYYADNSRDFFHSFYKKLVEGNPMRSSYIEQCRSFMFVPQQRLNKKVESVDEIIFPKLNHSGKYKEIWI